MCETGIPAEIFRFDTKTMIGVLFLGNITITVLIYAFRSANLLTYNKLQIDLLARLRLLYAVGYLLLFLRGVLPDMISVNIGNTLLFICFYLEGKLLLADLEGRMKQLLHKVQLCIISLAVAGFNLVETIGKHPAERVTMASISIFSILLLPSVILVFSGQASQFKRKVGVYYIILLLSLIPRIIMSVIHSDVNIHSNTLYQTFFFLSLILLMMVGSVSQLLFLKEESDKMIQKMATLDCLTNIENRHHFKQHAPRLFEKQKNGRKGLALLFFDIDHFKTINDRYGHPFGDEVLVCFANVIKSKVRSSDLSCRYGGEEFVVILLNQNAEFAVKVARRIMEELKTMQFEGAPGFTFTTSVGLVAGIPQADETLDDFIRKGDLALYRAKETGRNKIVVFDEMKGSSSSF